MKKNAGLTLVEIILSVTLLGLIGTALTALGITALRTADATRRRSIAAEYSKEALEAVRSIRDQQGWQNFAANLGNFCLDNTSGRFFLISAGGSPCPAVSGYTRTITISNVSPPNSNQRKVLIVTSYDERGAQMNVSLNTLLTNWR